MKFLPRIAHAAALGIAMLLVCGGLPASASYVINITQQGSNVVAIGSGSFDLTSALLPEDAALTAYIKPDGPIIVTGPPVPYLTYDATEYLMSWTSAPTNFGTNTAYDGDASAGTSNPIGIASDFLIVPYHYFSGSMVTSNSTWDNRTLADMGLLSGTYTWTWGSGANAGSITLNIVPEPSSLVLLVLPLGFLISRATCTPKKITQGRS